MTAPTCSEFMVRLIAAGYIGEALVRERTKWAGADMRRILAGETEFGRNLIVGCALRHVRGEKMARSVRKVSR